jgi:hypothetical protein
MKKNLLATTALVAAGVLASQGAFAESKPISLKVGGYMEQWVGFASYDETGASTVNDVDVQQDAEIHFSGSTTLDNGLTFGVNVQLEAESDFAGAAANNSDTIDEAYAFMRGDFGEVLLGMENGVAYAMHYGFGDFGAGTGLNTGDLGQWFLATDAYQLSGTYQGLRHRDNDSNKIRWISPRFSGFQVGADYSPEATQDDDGFPTEGSNVGTPENVWSVAGNYQNKLGSVDLGVSAGFQGIGDGNGATGSDPYNYGLGIYVGFSGFKLSASWTHENDYGSAANIADRDVMGAGVSWGSGPMKVGLDFAYGKQDYTTAGSKDTKQIAVQLGGTYILGPGVEARGSIFYADQSDIRGVAGDDADGFAVVGGIRLVF